MEGVVCMSADGDGMLHAAEVVLVAAAVVVGNACRTKRQNVVVRGAVIVEMFGHCRDELPNQR